MSAAIAMALVGVAGLPLAYVVTRSLPLAFLLSPLATAVIAAAATIFMLVTGGNLLFWLALLLPLQAVLVWRLRGRDGTALPHSSWVDVVLLSAPLLLPLTLSAAQPVGWDAHSIWWLHAAYFSHDASFARESIGNPGYNFSHPDYPPLLSAPIAAVWALLGGHDFRVAQAISVLLTFSAIGLLVYAVRRATSAAPALVSWFVAVGVGYASWDPARNAVTAGFSDALWAASWSAAVLLLLSGKEQLSRPALPLILMTAAGLAKNEGFIMVITLAAVVTWRERRNLRRAALMWVPVGAGLSWMLLSRLLGAESDVAAGALFAELLGGKLDVSTRLGMIFNAMWHEIGVVVAFTIAVAVLGGIFLRRERRELGLSSDLWLWTVNLAYFAILTLIYLVTPADLDWHLQTSVERVVLPNLLLACASAACWMAVAIGPKRSRAEERSLIREPAPIADPLRLD